MNAQERVDAALEKVLDVGLPDEGHHSIWLIDQMVRALTGCPVVTATAPDGRGGSSTYETLGESEEYRQFVRDYMDGEDGPETYTWNTGIAP